MGLGSNFVYGESSQADIVIVREGAVSEDLSGTPTFG